MKKMWKSVVALLIACLLLIPVGTASAAFGPDLDMACSITVNLPEHLGAEPDNFVVDLYCVAGLQSVDGYQDVSIVAKDGPFGALAEDLKPDEYDKYDWEAAAQRALMIAMDTEPVYSGCPLNTPIEYLEAGVYLVVVRGIDQDQVNLKEYVDEETGESMYSTVVNAGTYEYVFSPVLVTLPNLEDGSDNTTANGGNWIYNMTISLKGDENKRSQKKLILHKKSESGVLLPDAEFKLYATRTADTPDTDDTITTYVEGVGYVTLYCVGTYTTDKNGNIELEAPILDDNTLYAWVETRAPENYELDLEPHFFFAYGIIIPNDYSEWINAPGILDTHLRYDSDSPNNTGGITFERSAYGDMNTISFSNSEEGQPVYVRARAYSSEENTLDGESLGYFGVLGTPADDVSWRDGGDNYYYYTNILYPGETTVALNVIVAGPDVTDKDGSSLPLAGRAAIVYDFVPVQYDESGYPLDADWAWDPLNSDAEELSLPSDASPVQPIASARGGYIIDLGSGEGVKRTGTARYVETCYYNWDYSDSDNGITVINKFHETPPDNPGFLLPETGGIGTIVFTVTGGAIIATALLLLAIKAIKKRRYA